MPSTIEIDRAEVVFPQRCCRCQQPDPPLLWPVDVRRGVDLIVLRWQTVVEVDVPICEACASRRTWAGRLVVPALLVLIFGWIIATVAVFDGSAPQVVGGVALMGSVPLVLWGRFRLHRWIDLRFVGAAGVRLGDDDRVARLQITDGDYASETLALSRPYST